jgi:hypothetical protein
MDAIQGDIENVRAACIWAATQGRTGRLLRAVDALSWFYYRGDANYQQGGITFRRLEGALAAAEIRSSSATAGAQCTMARVLACQSTFRSLTGDRQTSKRLIRESLAILDSPTLVDEDTGLERAHIAQQSGYYELYAHPVTARQHFAESFRLYQEAGHKLGMVYALLGLGRAASYHGAQEEAREVMNQSFSLHQDNGNQVGESETKAKLGGLVAVKQFRFQE